MHSLPLLHRLTGTPVILLGEGEAALADLLQGGRAWRARQPPMSLSNYPDLDYGLVDARYFEPRPSRAWQATVSEALLLTWWWQHGRKEQYAAD